MNFKDAGIGCLRGRLFYLEESSLAALATIFFLALPGAGAQTGPLCGFFTNPLHWPIVAGNCFLGSHLPFPDGSEFESRSRQANLSKVSADLSMHPPSLKH